MSKEAIEAFLAQMRERHATEIEAIELPEGTEDYLRERVEVGDEATLTFMLKLSYLMGLHTGFAAQQEQSSDRTGTPPGSLKA
ncbi:MAG: hypothetical protein AVDCRST_MAG93-5214 [uncultured Chloroflexia bacterium]|uniref:Uncharacterized protein n=1 Tax=uncultured Chloroflexia bacterium TaxID=1672391 RepID=A0A6J4KNK5_9CHLR|nr:MAG: hypothetical protein AVDCRST_MAG93-5214 [uncultured Chloroflexia bacterium]